MSLTGQLSVNSLLRKVGVVLCNSRQRGAAPRLLPALGPVHPGGLVDNLNSRRILIGAEVKLTLTPGPMVRFWPGCRRRLRSRAATKSG